MIPAHVLLALMFTSSLDVTNMKKSTEVILFSEKTLDLDTSAKDVLKIKIKSAQPPKIKISMYVDPCKAGYIQDEKYEDKVKVSKKRTFFELRRCHQDVNFNGNKTKIFMNKNKLRACGTK